MLEKGEKKANRKRDAEQRGISIFSLCLEIKFARFILENFSQTDKN